MPDIICHFWSSWMPCPPRHPPPPILPLACTQSNQHPRKHPYGTRFVHWTASQPRIECWRWTLELASHWNKKANLILPRGFGLRFPCTATEPPENSTETYINSQWAHLGRKGLLRAHVKQRIIPYSCKMLSTEALTPSPWATPDSLPASLTRLPKDPPL